MKKHRFEIFLFFIYLLLAIICTWPLIVRFNSSIYGIAGDHFAQLWSDWWRKEALFSGKSLFYTPLLDAPFGFIYQASGFEPLHLGLRFLLTLLTSEVVSFNIWFLLSFPLSGLAVYLLVRELKTGRLAAAFSGLIFAFSMYRFSHAWEHSSLIFTWWMPLYVWGLVRFSKRRSVKSAIFAAFLFAAVLLDNFYYGYFTIFFTFFFFLFQIRRWLNWRGLKFLLLFLVSCFLFSVPFIFPTVKTALTGGAADTTAYQRDFGDLNWQSARPWFYFLPSPRHPVLGGFSQRVLDWIAAKPPYFLTQQYDGNEHNLYLTWTALILSSVAVFGLIRSEPRSDTRRWVWTFFFLAIVMAIFSAPPMATLSGLRIYFPSHYLYKIFPMFRAYARFGVLVLLCVSVLAGFGLKFLFSVVAGLVPTSRRPFHFAEASGGRQGSQLQYTITAVLSGFVIFEILLPPMNVNLTPPDAYLWLKEQPGDFIVMEYPLPTDHSDLLYQRVHHKRLFDPRRVGGQKILRSLIDRDLTDEALSENVIEFPSALKKIGVKYVIFHKRDKNLPVILENFEWKGYKPVAKFSKAIVFEVSGE